MPIDTILRWPQVKKMTNLSRTTVWRMEKQGLFPKRVQISLKNIGWRESEIKIWQQDLQPVDKAEQ